MGWCPCLHFPGRHGAQGIPVASRDPGCVQARQTLNRNSEVVWSAVWPYPCLAGPSLLTFLDFEGVKRDKLDVWCHKKPRAQLLVKSRCSVEKAQQQLLEFPLFSPPKAKGSVKHREGRNDLRRGCWEPGKEEEHSFWVFILSYAPNPHVSACSIFTAFPKSLFSECMY